MQVVLHDRNEKFQRAIAQNDLHQSDVVIGFDTSSNVLADRAAALGKPLILDQTIAHPHTKRRVYDNVRKQFPTWSSDLEIRAANIGAAEEAEHEKARQIVVASSFSQRTLIENGVSKGKITVNPYGVDLGRFSYPPKVSLGRPFRFLFAGLVSARKGIPLLLETWKTLNPADAKLFIAGPLSPTAPAEWLYGEHITFLDKLPHARLASVMADSDVFVFPSYFEGFALVLLEAM